MKSKIRIALFSIAALILIITACTANKPLDTLDAAQVTTLGNDCREIAAMQIDAWATMDSENLRDVYTDDIVHFDAEPAYIGIKEVIDMANMMYRNLPTWQMSLGDTYISADKCFGTWLNWEVLDRTKDNPASEYDLLETRDGKISYWTLFYARDFFGPPEKDDSLELKFASTWSEGDPDKIKSMYTKDAEIEDSLFGISISGQRKVSNYARRFLAKAIHPNWELKESFDGGKAGFPYKEEYPFASEGGIYAVSVTDESNQTCNLRIAIILHRTDDGLITKQETFYAPASLIECGWAE